MTPHLDRIPLLAALPTGALLPQTHGSRTAAEVENAGAGARKGSEKIETGLGDAAKAPRARGVVASHGGGDRPTQ